MTPYKNGLIVFGGCYVDDVCYRDLFVFYPESSTWAKPKRFGDPPSPRGLHTASLVNETVYVFGGADAEGVQRNDLFLLDVETFSWTSKVPQGQLPDAREGHSAAVDGDLIYFFGGYVRERNVYVNDLFTLNTATLTWKLHVGTRGQPPSARSGHSVGVVNRQMFVYGGYSSENHDLDSLHYFDFQRQQWTEYVAVGDAPSRRHGASLVARPKTLFVIGGCNAEENACYNDTYALDLDAKRWGKMVVVAGESLQQTAALAKNSQGANNGTANGTISDAELNAFMKDDGAVNTGNGTVKPSLLELEPVQKNGASFIEFKTPNVVQAYRIRKQLKRAQKLAKKADGAAGAAAGSDGANGADDLNLADPTKLNSLLFEPSVPHYKSSAAVPSHIKPRNFAAAAQFVNGTDLFLFGGCTDDAIPCYWDIAALTIQTGFKVPEDPLALPTEVDDAPPNIDPNSEPDAVTPGTSSKYADRNEPDAPIPDEEEEAAKEIEAVNKMPLVAPDEPPKPKVRADLKSAVSEGEDLLIEEQASSKKDDEPKKEEDEPKKEEDEKKKEEDEKKKEVETKKEGDTKENDEEEKREAKKKLEAENNSERKTETEDELERKEKEAEDKKTAKEAAAKKKLEDEKYAEDLARRRKEMKDKPRYAKGEFESDNKKEENELLKKRSPPSDPEKSDKQREQEILSKVKSTGGAEGAVDAERAERVKKHTAERRELREAQLARGEKVTTSAADDEPTPENLHEYTDDIVQKMFVPVLIVMVLMLSCGVYVFCGDRTPPTKAHRSTKAPFTRVVS